ncbi:thioesterase family protein [Faecalispora anaeroviscerum]|uniref:thioesterase family protein n=1 Tax=Faecalispora anaeroviscerum TaxID=2991836 RepID=UPI0024BB7C33|nr:thioesterase family protein [Faecalispora anaeroviscerum]
MSELKIGQTISQDYTVTSADLASKLGSGSVDVLATPRLVALMEGVCARMLRDSLPEEITSVGSEVHIKHLAPTVEGVTIHIAATLVESDGRKFTFDVQASDNVGLISTCTHVRASVKRENYLKRVAERAKQ